MNKLVKRIDSKLSGLIILFCVLYIVAFSLIAINRYHQFEVFYYDFGIFDRAIWQVSQFKLPIIDHHMVGGKVILADHFNPGIFLLSPLYWLIKDQTIILIAQATAVGLSGWFVFLTAKKYLESFLASAITVSYLLFIGLQNALIFDFHAVTVSVLFLSIVFWAIVHKKQTIFWLAWLVSLTFKESIFTLAPGLAWYIWWVQPQWRKQAIGLVLGSIAYGWATINLIIPSISDSGYQYKTQITWTPTYIIPRLFLPIIKIKTVLKSLLSFGFLPLLSFQIWPLLLSDLFVRFVPAGTEGRWELGLHYSVHLALILAIGSIHGSKYLSSWLGSKYWQKIYLGLALLLLGLSTSLSFLFFHGPIHLAHNKAFYTHSNNFGFLNQLIDAIPKTATVMTHNNLASHLTHHQNIWLLNNDFLRKKPDFIVMDLRQEQSPNNYAFGSSMQDFIKELLFNPEYTLVFSSGEQVILQHNQSSQQLTTDDTVLNRWNKILLEMLDQSILVPADLEMNVDSDSVNFTHHNSQETIFKLSVVTQESLDIEDWFKTTDMEDIQNLIPIKQYHFSGLPVYELSTTEEKNDRYFFFKIDDTIYSFYLPEAKEHLLLQAARILQSIDTSSN